MPDQHGPDLCVASLPFCAALQVELTRLLASGRMDYNTVQQLATPELVRGPGGRGGAHGASWGRVDVGGMGAQVEQHVQHGPSSVTTAGTHCGCWLRAGVSSQLFDGV